MHWSIARALGHTADARTATVLVTLAGHADPDVRYQVALSLPSVLTGDPGDAGVVALLQLCGDTDPAVRNWATFGLGWQCCADGAEIRRVLWQRSTDSDPDTRAEGIRGLARRRVPGVLPLLAGLHAEESVHPFTLDAAALLGHPALVPLLEKLGADDALRECDPVRRASRDRAADSLLDILQARRPGLDLALFGERCEVGLSLVAFDGSPARESGRWSVEALLARADGDPRVAAQLVLGSISGP